MTIVIYGAVAICPEDAETLNEALIFLKHEVQYFFPLKVWRFGLWNLLWIGARRAQTPPAPEEPFLCLEKAILFFPLPQLAQINIVICSFELVSHNWFTQLW